MADSYTIVSQQQILDTADVTNPVQAMRVQFRSVANGTTGTVDIPLLGYTPAEVNRLVSERVALIDAVHEL